MKLLLRGVRVIDPAVALDRPGCDVLLENGRLRALEPHLEVEGARELDLRRDAVHQQCVLSPAFTDLHTHLREPGGENAETVQSGSRAAAAGGFSCVLAMANTTPPIDDAEAVRSAVARADAAKVRVLTVAAVSRGLRGAELVDMESCAAAGAVAFSDDGRNAYGGPLLERALRAAGAVERPVLVHPEDETMLAATYAAAPRCAQRPAQLESRAVATALAALRAAGGRLHLQHVSTAESVALIRAARDEGLAVTAEVTPHHLALVDAEHTPWHRVNPPLRSERDRTAVLQALCDGIIDAVATDHAPHTAAAKGAVFETAAPGMIGLETALPLCLSLLGEGLTLPLLIERLTIGPHRVLANAGVPTPSLQRDLPVSCTLIDPIREWTPSAETLHSLSLNTPLLGTAVAGAVLLTMVEGRVAHADASLAGAFMQEAVNV